MAGNGTRAAIVAMQYVRTPLLDIACEQGGSPDGYPVVLVHGWPYDPRAFDEVATILTAAGFRTIVPYLRGYGGTRFLSRQTMRSGQQAAIGHDLRDLLDALGIDHAVVAGFDWGARAACIVAALWPERVHGLVTCCGYQIQNIAAARNPADPGTEQRWWYQYYFHTDRGREALTHRRDELLRHCWKLWSPTWDFDEPTYMRTAKSFENPDFVDITLHSYRHRHGNAPGDPRYAHTEATLASEPRIPVPTITVQGAVDEVMVAKRSEDHARHFSGPYERRLFENVGHNAPQESPRSFAQAILALCPR